MIFLHAQVRKPFQKERGLGGEPLPAAWSLKIDGFQKDLARKEVSIGRVAGTAQELTLLVVSAYNRVTHTTQPQYALLRRKSSRPGEPIQLGMMMMMMMMMMIMMGDE